jgi:hypothetical protein
MKASIFISLLLLFVISFGNEELIEEEGQLRRLLAVPKIRITNNAGLKDLTNYPPLTDYNCRDLNGNIDIFGNCRWFGRNYYFVTLEIRNIFCARHLRYIDSYLPGNTRIIEQPVSLINARTKQFTIRSYNYDNNPNTGVIRYKVQLASTPASDYLILDIYWYYNGDDRDQKWGFALGHKTRNNLGLNDIYDCWESKRLGNNICGTYPNDSGYRLYETGLDIKEIQVNTRIKDSFGLRALGRMFNPESQDFPNENRFGFVISTTIRPAGNNWVMGC